jgi:hypothetical protein
MAKRYGLDENKSRSEWDSFKDNLVPCTLLDLMEASLVPDGKNSDGFGPYSDDQSGIKNVVGIVLSW